MDEEREAISEKNSTRKEKMEMKIKMKMKKSSKSGLKITYGIIMEIERRRTTDCESAGLQILRCPCSRTMIRWRMN